MIFINLLSYAALFLFSSTALAAESLFCTKNYAIFSYEINQPYTNGYFVPGWGPKRAPLLLANDLKSCMNSLNWQRRRIIAAADYWIQQKLNYCHHYLPSYLASPTTIKQPNQGGYCSSAVNKLPVSKLYKQIIRWNYSGIGNETKDKWINQNRWKGVDCSNFTAFIYNFAFGIQFSSQVEWQSGKRKGKQQLNLSPNQQDEFNILDNPLAAGNLVCADNSVEVNHSCAGHGGYLSVIDSQGIKHKGAVTAASLSSLPLHPGDLLFISATRARSLNPSKVTHVVVWTGKQVGYGSNDIHPSQIAPNNLCTYEDWKPRIGDWVIADSHYQGADYRILTSCFYLDNLWGVRRVLQ